MVHYLMHLWTILYSKCAKMASWPINLIEKHHFEVLKVKYSDGSIRQGAVLDLSSASTWWDLEGENGL